MIQVFDALDSGADFVMMVVTMLVVVVIVQAWMVRQARQEIATWRRQSEELACWGDLQIEEINALRRRLDAAERRHANLQAMYADLVCRRLAQSYLIVANCCKKGSRR